MKNCQYFFFCSSIRILYKVFLDIDCKYAYLFGYLSSIKSKGIHRFELLSHYKGSQIHHNHFLYIFHTLKYFIHICIYSFVLYFVKKNQISPTSTEPQETLACIMIFMKVNQMFFNNLMNSITISANFQISALLDSHFKTKSPFLNSTVAFESNVKL